MTWLNVDSDTATQQLLYINAAGKDIVSEVRSIRFAWDSYQRRYIDLEVHVRYVADEGPRPFFVMARASERFDIPKTGRVSMAPGASMSDEAPPYLRAAWVDASGPTGDPPPPPPAGPPEVLVDIPGALVTERGPGSGPWNGIAILDHPSNSGYPNLVGKYAVAKQLTQSHYPPADAPNGPFSFRTRVFVHHGDARAGDVAAVSDAYARS